MLSNQEGCQTKNIVKQKTLSHKTNPNKTKQNQINVPPIGPSVLRFAEFFIFIRGTEEINCECYVSYKYLQFKLQEHT